MTCSQSLEERTRSATSAKMTVLAELGEHHADEEEKEMELQSLGAQMEERFEPFRRKASEAA